MFDNSILSFTNLHTFVFNGTFEDFIWMVCRLNEI